LLIKSNIFVINEDMFIVEKRSNNYSSNVIIHMT